MADILIVSRDDWANMGYAFQKALQAVGVDALAIKTRPHVFDYGEEARIVESPKEVADLYKEAKGILWMHSRADIKPAGFDLKSTFSVVFHGGSAYRKNPAGVNRVFNPIVQATIIQTADLLGLGAVNEHWILPPIDTERIQPEFGLHDPIIVGHYPRHPVLKGSASVNLVMQSLMADEKLRDVFEYRFDDSNAPWDEYVQRIRECDIYIERLPREDDTAFQVREWGLTALEAAALGKIVFTTFSSKDAYEDAYGKCPLVVANAAEELEEQLRTYLTAHKNKRTSAQKRTRKWVEEHHSYAAIGERLKVVFESCL
jgi:hypothetical protein